MDAEQLRSVQAPLKARYRERPDAALVTLRARGRVGEGVSCRIETGKALVVAGLHPATGGSGQAACSGDMLLEALVACAGVTLNAVATALGIALRDAAIEAAGDLDFRGTLGLAKDVPVGLQNIRLKFTLDTDASEEQLAALLRLTERYCVVFQTLAHPPGIAVSIGRALV
ncbi:MAG: OsmC family protein [Sterolibacteriaceae bacterium]|nr:OsmC family protein [Candidatus Methylophosphatis haderslevensis]